MQQRSLNKLGNTLAISGTTLSIIGTLWNNIALSHTTAMWFWALSNPLLLVWAIGSYKKWWNGSISIEALGVMYFVFSATNFYGLFIS